MPFRTPLRIFMKIWLSFYHIKVKSLASLHWRILISLFFFLSYQRTIDFEKCTMTDTDYDWTIIAADVFSILSLLCS